MLAMLFIAEQRVTHQPGLALLIPRDIVEILARDPAAQAGVQGCADRADQPAPRTKARRH
jgi:hypothetical protein